MQIAAWGITNPSAVSPIPYQEKTMSGENVIDEFQQREAEQIAEARKFNLWSRALLEMMIEEYEQKLLASDLPVEGTGDEFWEEGINGQIPPVAPGRA